MSHRFPLRSTALTALGAALFCAGAQAQQFIDNQTDIPQGNPNNNSRSENVDFGDVDNDGDWDAVFADGGDFDQDQNRIWINLGPGASLGVFNDQTNARLPAVNDQSRDIEFVDFDNDGDLDLYTSNTAAITPQSNRWWRNNGVHTGTYVDETSTRWVGLGAAGSSIANSQLLPGGGFIDFSCDCDFGDLDNDGDLDLVHSSYGGVFGGQVPTRIFLNDGLGFFSEFNPSGAQLTGQTISNGFPGIWCQGTQQSNTTNTTGANCDVASSALDIDVGDVDGDFDLDILHGARQEAPRMFTNRLEENGGTLGFRDTTGLAFPAGYSTGDGHYEQEMGDLDGDGDLDIYGLNWHQGGFDFTDITLVGNGNGTFSNAVELSGSDSDDNEGDFFDYDNDGDLDLYVANFSGADRLYRNNNNGGATFSFTNVSGTMLPGGLGGFISLDGDCCDVDSDGDYDVFVANDDNDRNLYLENPTTANDTHAPYLPHLEQAPDRATGPDPTIVRVHVYDNAPYYITWYNTTVLEYQVNGGSFTSVPMMSSAGQVFRGEIPGNLSGTICYRAVSSDEYGNTGMSALLCFDASGGGGPGTALCFGDGSGAACGCANNGAAGEGCENSTGNGAILSGSGTASLSSDSLVLEALQSTNQPGVFFQGVTTLGSPSTFGDGIRCCGGSVARLITVAAQGNCASTNQPAGCGTQVGGIGGPISDHPMNSGLSAGDTRCYQFWYRDPSGGNPCQNQFFNLSNAYQVTWGA